MAAPARITIELEAPSGPRGRWRTRTRVEGDLRASSLPGSLPPLIAVTTDDVEHGEPAVVPVGYEPVECTCGDGMCDADHEHE